MKIENEPSAWGTLAGLLVFLAGLLVWDAGCAPPPSALANDTTITIISVDDASSVYATQARVIDQIGADYGVDIPVMWAPCGEINSFYSPSQKMVVLCTELSQYPGFAVLVAAHEAAHAITEARIATTDEADADEIAALFMIRHGYQRQLLEAATSVLGLGWPLEHASGDPHPGALFRSWLFACLEAGSDGGPLECRVLYVGLADLWDTRMPRVVP